MFDLGHGSPIVMIPGIQGRWEWMRPSIEALSARHRVLTFSLSDVSPSGTWFDAWDRLIDEALDARGLSSAAIVGVSFGGIVAARYAARRPERVTHLVLVSTPDPQLRLDTEQAGYLRRPRLSAPLFAWRALRRLLPEITAACPSRPARWRCLAGHIGRVIRYPASPRRMSAWVREWQSHAGVAPYAAIAAATLIVTGEPQLDRVVPTSSTLRYLDLIPRARHVTLPDTGHIGVVSAPEAFARIVGEFIEHA